MQVMKREPVTIGADQQGATEFSLELRHSPLHRGLIDAERFGRGGRTAVACDGEQVLQVVPVEHESVMQFCGPLWQVRGYRARVAGPKIPTR